jgi:hypothetical protein
MYDDSMTLGEARVVMSDNAEKGAPCPCCERLVKLYKRKLHAEMAKFLIKLVVMFKRDKGWHSSREILPSAVKASTDGSYLVYWGLIEKMPSENPAGGKAGMYRPTQSGIDFVENKISVASHIHMLCGKHVGFGKMQVTIVDCLGSRFDYGELMAGG